MVLALMWANFMILTGDIPVVLDVSEVKGITIALLVTVLLYSLYLRKSRLNLLNLVQIIPLLFLWGMCLVEELKFSFHPFARIVEIVRFGLVLIVFLQILFKITKSIIKRFNKVNI